MASAAPLLAPERATVDARTVGVPRLFQAVALLLILFTGTLPLLVQAYLHGAVGGSAFALTLAIGFILDLVRVAPLIVLARHPLGILHPLIIAVVVWPFLSGLPRLIDSVGGYAGVLSGQPVQPPAFIALAAAEVFSVWLSIARYHGVELAALLSVYAGFALFRPGVERRVRLFREVDSLKVRRALIAIICLNLGAVAVFLQLRGGVVQHVFELAYGRYRALAGLGPFLALFDIGFLSMLLWTCLRPQDVRQPVYIVLLLVVGAQQFIVAGSRAAALLVFVLMGLGWALAVRRVPWKLAIMILPVAFLSIGALNLVRTAGVTGDTFAEAIEDTTFTELASRSQEEFAAREAVSGSVPVVADGLRTTGLQWGYTYAGAAFALIPRAVWPDKPRGPGSLYAQAFLNEPVEGTAVPITPVAEAFWNFHLPGVILIFALYGLVLRRAFELLHSNAENGFVIAVFVIVVTQFGVGTDQLVAIQQTVLTALLLVGLVALFVPDIVRSRPAVA